MAHPACQSARTSMLRNVEVLARIIERVAMLRYLRSFGVGGANQFCFLLFAICGFWTALNATGNLN